MKIIGWTTASELADQVGAPGDVEFIKQRLPVLEEKGLIVGCHIEGEESLWAFNPNGELAERPNAPDSKSGEL